jgi:ribose transport system substrate-binding protein
MTFDSDAPDSKRFAYYGVDDLETGQRLMAELAKLMDGKGKVAILAGNQNAPNLQKRAEGVRREAQKHPGIEIIGTFYHVETPQDAAAKVLEVMKSRPEVNGWAMIGGWALFTKTLLTDIDPAKVKLCSVDALPAQLPYVQKGIAPLLLAQPTYLWGYRSVEIILDKLHFKKDVPVINKMELVPVTKQTLGSWSRQLKAWGFDDVPPDYLELP